ncbi:biotin-[protein] holoenzyme synthetase putative transcriptional repressor of biotin synthesis (BirA family) [Luminiphilus syltensis NOR5-1B]|uniref:Biotin-[protein] holoenzyme synthetase putative transcriptional repressor of biotin synthesis (BirA family) n=1 Tax=Luminiphilus syltensis NOR5-1B TaxID=565045 RepID=B8KWC8_9GAMM|nr:biotin--[acetyl-CoA-carboxylase] ligase [Luminiphilus syltensis]EED34157.1 biotin-[protein] holoenzyme synthetase putative transcriptional repressor of biotin synthesis (BirA family) [Luminiphilus syltensis NOR5-1B]
MSSVPIKPLSLLESLSSGISQSADALADTHGCDVSCIDQAIDALKAQGFDIRIEKSQVTLVAPLELLSAQTIQRELEQRYSLSLGIEVVPEVGSTNEVLLRRAFMADDPLTIHGKVFLAEQQLGGRGRRGRSWVSPMAQNLYLSIGWCFDAGVEAMAGLSLAVGVAVAGGIRECCGVDVSLKWPNDVYLAGHKVGGVLIETAGDASGPCAAVIGIGINVAMRGASSNAITQDWTALERHSEFIISRITLQFACCLS